PYNLQGTLFEVHQHFKPLLETIYYQYTAFIYPLFNLLCKVYLLLYLKKIIIILNKVSSIQAVYAGNSKTVFLSSASLLFLNGTFIWLHKLSFEKNFRSKPSSRSFPENFIFCVYYSLHSTFFIIVCLAFYLQFGLCKATQRFSQELSSENCNRQKIVHEIVQLCQLNRAFQLLFSPLLLLYVASELADMIASLCLFVYLPFASILANLLGQSDAFRAKVANHNRIVVHELGPVFGDDLSTNIFQLCHIDADFVIDLLLLVTNCSFLIIQTSHSN
ncbi:hypothetical protein TYRP_020466, partial [Tyrophagus putrescentiae]